MQPNHLEERYIFIQSIAENLCNIALSYFHKWDTLFVEQKESPHDLVSIADKDLEDYIRAQIVKKFPTDNILGEESDYKYTNSDISWVIDPIDGTYAFLHGIPLWCISIAVLYKGEPYFGIIIDANHKEIFTAFKGKGAYCNNKPIQSIKKANIQSASVAFGIDKGVRASFAQKFIIRAIENKIHLARTYTCALNMAWVASGRMLGVFYPYVSSWDYCAGLVLINEAGGQHNHPLHKDNIKKGGALLATAQDVYDDLADLSQIYELQNLE